MKAPSRDPFSHRLNRRTALRTLIGGTIAAGTVVARAQRASTEADTAKKVSKAQAHYQDQPKDVRSCGTCSYFEPSEGCSVMAGKVTSSGWCDLYALID